MSSKPVDAVSSFADIVENVPRWRQRVSDMAAYTAQKHNEFKLEYTKLVHKAKPRRSKNRSICSIHSNEDKDVHMTSPIPSSTEQTPHNPVDFSPLEAGNQYIYAQANKKRRTGTSLRSGASGPLKFRSKQMVVIYYDGYVQEQLEILVKEFGSCRNLLRKGRTSYTVSKGLQLPSLRRGLDQGLSVANRPGLMSKSSPKLPASKDQSLTTVSPPTGEAAFLQADKDLESCQNACETAAHQFLRDGDCRTELDTVLNKLDSVLELAKVTHTMLKSEEEEERKTERSNSMSDSVHTTSGSTLVEKQSREQMTPFRKPGQPVESDTGPPWLKDRPALNTTVSAPPVTMDIEVDDDSDASDIEIDIRQFAMNRTNRMHT